MRKGVNFSTDYLVGPTGNQTQYFTGLFEKAGAKAELGFSVSVIDIFGPWFRQYLPQSWGYKSYSEIAAANHSFALGTGPMPIISLAEVVLALSPDIGGIMYPGFNSTNFATLTNYEVNPSNMAAGRAAGSRHFSPQSGSAPVCDRANRKTTRPASKVSTK